MEQSKTQYEQNSMILLRFKDLLQYNNSLINSLEWNKKQFDYKMKSFIN